MGCILPGAPRNRVASMPYQQWACDVKTIPFQLLERLMPRAKNKLSAGDETDG